MYIWQKCTVKSVNDVIKQTMNTINSNDYVAIKLIAKFGFSVWCFRVGIIRGPLRGWHSLFSGVLDPD